ncbi:MAG: VOC family protein [Pseudomonadota bacterium]
MIGYVTVGARDIPKAAKFYDALAGVMNVPRLMGSEDENFIAWGTQDAAGFGILKPFDGGPVSVGNGVMVALMAESPEQVDQIYKTALANGGTDEGAPGPRGEGGFYAAYFRDLDGHKLNAFCMVAPS